MHRNLRNHFQPIAAVLLVAFAAACKQQAPPETQPMDVTITRPIVKGITEWDEFTGRLEAVESVEIRARVSGYLESIHFKDGQIVKKGDLLFVIDPRPYKAEVDRAKGEMERAQVQVELAKSDFDRAKRLIESKAISEEDFDRRSKALLQADAALRSAKAAFDSSQLNLEFTEIRAPIDGRISRHFVSQGNLVSGGITQATVLTTIVPFDPIHVYFDVDERTVLKYTRLNLTGERPTSRDVANPVQVALSDEETFKHDGTMDFVENRLDAQTATLRGRALISNPQGMLTPGLFARVRLKGRGPYQATLLTDEAIGTDQAQRFVLTIGTNNTVERKYVKVGRQYEGLRIIQDGLKPDDRIILKGLQRARMGQQVNPVEDTAKNTATGQGGKQQ